MSARELAWWRVADRLYPIGADRDDIRGAQLLSVVAGGLGVKKLPPQWYGCIRGEPRYAKPKPRSFVREFALKAGLKVVPRHGG